MSNLRAAGQTPALKKGLPSSPSIPSEDFSTHYAFNYSQAAAYAGVHFSAIEVVVRSGHLPARRLGRNIIVLKKDLDAFLESLELVYTQKRGAA
jgi:excisionase family DNA binding protein